MPEYKNQHYVPRAHLKPFSLGGSGKAINIHLVQKDRPVWGAPISGQCAKSYFYGEDGQLERLLGRLEGAYGSLVGRLVDESFRLDDQDQWLLRYFILLQSLRTAEQVGRALVRLTHMADFFRKSEEAHGQVWDSSQDPTPRGALQELMLAFNDQLQAGTIDDLKVVIEPPRDCRRP